MRETEAERAERVDTEYRLTLAALAVVCERLLAINHANAVVISDQAMANRPDLMAWRDNETRTTIITVSR